MSFRIVKGLEEQIADSLLEKAEYAAKYDLEIARQVFQQYLDAYYLDYSKKILNPPFLESYINRLAQPINTGYVGINVSATIRYLLFVNTMDFLIFNFNANNRLPHGYEH